MREFYKNSKLNTLRRIVFKNKTKQLPYLRLVPRNEIRFRKSKRGNTLQYYYGILPNNEYRRFKCKGKNYHIFSCVENNMYIIRKLKVRVRDVSALNEIKKNTYEKNGNLEFMSSKDNEK